MVLVWDLLHEKWITPSHCCPPIHSRTVDIVHNALHIHTIPLQSMVPLVVAEETTAVGVHLSHIGSLYYDLLLALTVVQANTIQYRWAGGSMAPQEVLLHIYCCIPEGVISIVLLTHTISEGQTLSCALYFIPLSIYKAYLLSK